MTTRPTQPTPPALADALELARCLLGGVCLVLATLAAWCATP